MSKNLISQSPRNIRSINLSIAEGILRALEGSLKGLEESLLVERGLLKAIELDQHVQKLTTKGDETIMELRRLGLIDRKKVDTTNVYTLCIEGQTALSMIDRIGRETYFFEALYEKEPLFRQFVDMLQRRGKLSNEEAIEISGINRVKIDFIKSILQQIPSVARLHREGRKSFIEYVKSEPLLPSEIRRAIIKYYYTLQGSRLFVSIDELWRAMYKEYPNLSEELFDKSVLSLANDYIGKVELVQGVSSPQAKLLFDKRSGTYFHYLKIPQYILDVEMKK
jgi:hypothetical protein